MKKEGICRTTRVDFGERVGEDGDGKREQNRSRKESYLFFWGGRGWNVSLPIMGKKLTGARKKKEVAFC